MKKEFKNNIKTINENIKEVEKLLKESMNFYEEDSMEDENLNDFDEEEFETTEMDEPVENNIETPSIENKNIDSYVDHIRKYALNGLSALCENPESEEYQMLKKIFQMCDKKPENKEKMTESHRLFGISKNNNKVLFETKINSKKELKNLKNTIIKEAIEKGYNPSNIKLVSENKIVR
jgi:hypothetical protein